jgi:hypothetical protein
VNDSENNPSNQNFIKKNRKFKAGEFYSVSQFYGISYATGDGTDIINSDLTQPKYRTLGIIQTEESFIDASITGNTPTEIITETDFPSNTNPNNTDKYFGSQWINMCLFQIQFAATDRRTDNRVRTAGFLLEDSRDSRMFFIRDNTQNLGGGRFNSKGFISARYHYFDFINVKREDIIKMSTLSKKIIRPDVDGLNINDYKYTSNGTVLATIPTGSLGGNLVGRDLNGSSPYIYKGLYEADCINYLISLNLI